MGRSERLNKLGDIWFSSKCILVQRRAFACGGRALIGLGPLIGYQTLTNSEFHRVSAAVRLWVITSVVERARTQTAS